MNRTCTAKKKPMSRERLIGCDALLSLFYLTRDAASARIASAASSVMSFPLSRLWIVIRETPSMAATCVGVPMDSRISLYSLAVMLGAGKFHLRADAGAFDFTEQLRAGLASRRAGREIPVVNVATHGRKLLETPCSVFVLFGLGNGAVCKWLGSHCLGWFGVDRSQWRRGERKIFLRVMQELSVKSFYTPFLRLNAGGHAPGEKGTANE